VLKTGLAQRMQLKTKVDRLINWAKQQVTTTPRGCVTIRLPNGIAVQLDKVKPEDILDMLAELAKT